MTVTLTRHARERVSEFGLPLDVVDEIARRPDVSHTDRAGASVRVCDHHPGWAVVVGDDGVIITVLRRTPERWEHDVTARPPTPLPTLPPVGEEDVATSPPPLRGPAASARRGPVGPRVPRAPVVAVRVDPAVMEVAHLLAEGDLRRLLIHADGAVTVLNRPRGPGASGVDHTRKYRL